MPVQPKTTLGRAVVRWGSIASSILAIGTLAAYFNIVPATSADIDKLDRKQTETAIEVYRNKVRSLLLAAPAEDTESYRIWKEELERARRQLRAAEERKIELSR